MSEVYFLIKSLFKQTIFVCRTDLIHPVELTCIIYNYTIINFFNSFADESDWSNRAEHK